MIDLYVGRAVNITDFARSIRSLCRVTSGLIDVKALGDPQSSDCVERVLLRYYTQDQARNKWSVVSHVDSYAQGKHAIFDLVRLDICGRTHEIERDIDQRSTTYI